MIRALKEPAMTTDLTDPIFHDEDAARAHFERIRWPHGPICPHCGVVGQATLVKGKSHRPGMYQCNACREPFSVKVGTVMESSHIPLAKWALGFHLMASSKKGVSAHQLHRMLKITYKSAWFMAHRIREAMRDTDPTPFGGEGKVVEADETFIGPNLDVFDNDKGWRKQSGTGGMRKVVTLVERGGRARSVKVHALKLDEIKKVLEIAAFDSVLYTDEANHYKRLGPKMFAQHDSINHGAGEYGRGDVHTNTIEGFFSIFKRGMRGVYQHCGDRHLQRYLDEFDFRYSNRVATGVDDTQRTARAIEGAQGKRLTYKRPGAA
jgi:transposase-like protein